MTTSAKKVALITGSAKRLGAVMAKTLHQAGYHVVIHYRHSSTDAKKLQEKLNKQRPASCFLIQADLLQLEDFTAFVKKIIQQTQRLDVLINNASTFYSTPIGTITTQDWDNLMGTNLKIPLFLSQAVVPYLKHTHGVIINIADIHGIRPMKNHPVYSSAKAGLIMLTQSLARELAPEIRVNGVAPGAILWPENQANHNGNLPNKILNKTALKRQGTAEDIAKTVLFLVQDANYITGHIIPVDGGRMLNH